MKKIKSPIARTVIYGFVAIIGIGVVGWLINIHTNVEQPKPVIKTVYIGRDNEELENFSREHAVDSLVDLLKEATKDVDGKERTIDERLEALEAGSDIYEVLTPKAIAGLYFEEEFGESEYNRRVTASTLLIQAKLVEEMNETFEPAIKLYDEAILFDEKLMSAQIPLDIIIGVSTGYAFDMVYIDGEWKLNPYSIIMSLKLSELIVNSQK